MASLLVAGWSKLQRPEGVASSGLAFQHTLSDRWGQQQGIFGHRPSQESGRPGVGRLRSVWEGEDPVQLAVQSWDRRGVFSPGIGGGSPCWLGQGSRQTH